VLPNKLFQPTPLSGAAELYRYHQSSNDYIGQLAGLFLKRVIVRFPLSGRSL